MSAHTEPIYLDHNATPPLDPAAMEAMIQAMQEDFGNPSSPYSLGVRARETAEQAGTRVARLLGCLSREGRHEMLKDDSHAEPDHG